MNEASPYYIGAALLGLGILVDAYLVAPLLKYLARRDHQRKLRRK